MKKKKKLKFSTEKQKAWALFSKYIRLRDALATIGNRRQCKCITCDDVRNIYGVGCMQAGHFIPGRNNAVLFNEEQVHGQCLTKHSNLRLFNGLNKSISKIRVGDKLWGFDEETFKKRFCIVEAINNFIPEELYEVELENGNKFYATPEHRVVASGGWYKIKDILHNMLAYDILEL